MNSETTHALNRIQELQFAFAENLTTRINELAQATVKIDSQFTPNSEDNAKHIKNTHNLAHKLAGSAGTFQFNEVYDAAKKLEQFCYILLDSTIPPKNPNS